MFSTPYISGKWTENCGEIPRICLHLHRKKKNLHYHCSAAPIKVLRLGTKAISVWPPAQNAVLSQARASKACFVSVAPWQLPGLFQTKETGCFKPAAFRRCSCLAVYEDAVPDPWFYLAARPSAHYLFTTYVRLAVKIANKHLPCGSVLQA